MNKDGKQVKKSGGFLKILPGLFVSLVIILILARIVDPAILAESFQNVSWRLILTVFCLQTLAFVFRGMAWRLILENRPTLMQCFWTITEGYLLNLLPLRLGEIGRAVIMGGLIRKSPFMVFSTVLLERLLDVIITLIILFLTVPLVSGAAISTTFYILLIVLIAGGLLTVVIILRNQEKFTQLLQRFISAESKFGKFFYPKLNALLGGMTILQDPLKFGTWLFWILMTWCCWIASLYLSVRTFFPHLPQWSSLFVQSVTALGGAIPSAPGGIGVIEGAFVTALSFFGVDQSVALGFGMFVHALGIVTPAVWGIAGFVVQGQRFTEIFHSLKQAEITTEGKKHE